MRSETSAQAPLDERDRFLVEQVVHLGHPHPAELQYVAEAQRSDQTRPRPVVLQDRVSGDRRAMDDLADVGCAQMVRVEQVGQRRGDTPRVVVGRRRHLARQDGTVGAQGDQVGEGPTNIDAYAHAYRLALRSVPSTLAAT